MTENLPHSTKSKTLVEAVLEATAASPEIVPVEVAVEQLKISLQIAAKLRETTYDGGRKAAIVALNSVVKFIDCVEGLEGRYLATPLVLLAGALRDISTGSVPEMLRPIKSKGRPRDTHVRSTLKGMSAGVMSILMMMGVPRDKAAKMVAKVMSNESVKLDGRRVLRGNTIAGWRDHMDSSDLDDPARAAYERLIALHSGLKPRAYYESLDKASLERIHNDVLARFSLNIAYLGEQ